MTQHQVYLPAEWEPQSAVMLTWPHPDSDWGTVLPEINALYKNILSILLLHVDVLVVVHPDYKTDIINTIDEVSTQRPNFNAAVFFSPSNDTWTRDHGPISIIKNDTPELLDFEFNGWGNKFPSEQDNAINQALTAQSAFSDTPMSIQKLVLEGGAIESDGKGCLLTTSSCLLNKNRNPTLAKEQIGQRLQATLGVKKILWLDHGYLEGDDTDSHIDTLARFAPNNTILYIKCDHVQDPHYNALKEMENQLKSFTNCNNEPFRLIALPWPDPIFDDQQLRLPATYANFLITNTAILLPIYDVAQDELAIEQLRIAFPDRPIYPINCTSLIKQHGSLHCITMQLPQGVTSLNHNKTKSLSL